MTKNKKNKKTLFLFYTVFAIVLVAVFFSHNYKNKNLINEAKAAVVTNIIANPGFESGTAPWGFYSNGIPTGSFIVSSPGYTGVSAGKVSIGAVGANIQFYQDGRTLQANTLYRLTFKAYSNSGHDVAVNLMGIPYVFYGLAYTVNLSTNWQTFTTEFTTSGFAGTVNNGRLQFWFSGAGLASAGDIYYFDDIVLEKVGDITITTQPSSQAVAAGAIATFSVTATGSSLSYQWQKNGVDIVGATNFNYTTPVAAPINNGDIYQVVITNATGGTTSNSAILTVASFISMDANVYGFAWSSNIGWISFNNRNCDTNNDGKSDNPILGCPAAGSFVQGYGVNMDINGKLSGFAWSENIGWITFNKAVAGTPPAAPYNNNGQTFIAKKNGSDEFEGWARVVSTGGSWDGWIKLSNFPAYGVNLNGSKFEGFAWGGDKVVGWISFNSKDCDPNSDGNPSDGSAACVEVGRNYAINPIPNYNVYFNVPNTSPTVTPLNPVILDYCVAPGVTGVRFSWDYEDTEDLDIQEKYQLIITREDGKTYDSGIRTSQAVDVYGTSINSEANCAPGSSCVGFIDYGNHTYSWTIQAWDSGNLTDGLKVGNNFGPTPSHTYPDAVFSCPAPDIACANTYPRLSSIQFTDNSVAYGGSSIVQYDWDFGDGDASSLQNPAHAYNASSAYNLKFKVTDDAGYWCETSKNINIGAAASPKWKEVIPR